MEHQDFYVLSRDFYFSLSKINRKGELEQFKKKIKSTFLKQRKTYAVILTSKSRKIKSGRKGEVCDVARIIEKEERAQ